MFKKRLTKSLAVVLIFILMSTFTVLAGSMNKQDILGEISANNIMVHLNVLSPGDDARIAGSDGERQAASYIESEFNKYGLVDIEQPTFNTVLFHDKGATFSVNSPDDIELSDNGALNMEFTTNGNFENMQLVYVGLGTYEECVAAGVSGKIALIKRGSYTFSEKVANAAKAGAKGAILFNNKMEEGFINGTLGSESAIPAIEIHPADGEALAALLQGGIIIHVSMSGSGEIEPVTSQNVIGNLYAKKQKNNTPTIVIGAHYDCVDTPGANDNGSGTATMLEIARVLSKKEHNANIKFIAFGAEEVGLVGAYDFVEGLSKNERKKIAAMINMDMVGVGDTVGIWTIGDKASAVLADLAEIYVDNAALTYEIGVEDRSDHAAFAENGIPAVYFSYETDKNYHTDEDKVIHIIPENVENIAKIVAEMAYDMAESPMLQSTQGFNGTVNKYRHINPNKTQK